jgi:hypothetical protein
VAVSGRKPKPRDQIRHRVPPVHDWTDVPNAPFMGGPSLPRLDRVRPSRGRVPEPRRPLGAIGLDTWKSLWAMARGPAEESMLLVLGEQLDERAALRVRVLRDNDPSDRHELRHLDAQVLSALGGWQLRHEPSRLATWPLATRQWWADVSTMPHAALWQPTDWRVALDTAYVHAAVANGEDRHLTELRIRERALGLTADARRDLRIRYVDVAPSDEEDPSITVMADYRRSVTEGSTT